MAKEKSIVIELQKPQEYVVEIEGDTPLLLHRLHLETDKKRKKAPPSPEEEAKQNCYFLEDGKTVGYPTNSIYRAIVNSGKQFSGRRSAKSTAMRELAAGMEVMPHPDALIPLLDGKEPYRIGDYAVDVRPVTIQKARIMRARPRFDRWKLRFIVKIDPELVDPELLAEVIVIAGRRNGLGDYRPASPACPGPFGKFHLTKFESVEADCK